MSELQSPNWNEAKIDPLQLQGAVAARLESIAKEHNANPSKFMAQLKGGGDTFGIGDMKTNNPMYEQEPKGASSSSFLMMGKAQNKKSARIQQLNSQYDAMGLPKSYSERKRDAQTYSRIMSGGGRVKKNNDPFSGGGDRALVEQCRIARQSLGTEGGYVSPQGIKCNPHIAMQLGGADLYNTMLDAGRENTNPHEYRALNGAVDGNVGLTDAAKLVSDDTKVAFVQKMDDPKPVATMLLSEDETKKVTKPKLMAPKPPGVDGPSPNGLMEA